MNLPKTFFGWSNLKWLITELVKMYSDKDSFFSKKRIEGGVAFIIMEWGMIHYLLLKIDKMDVTDLIMWAGVQAAVCGYTLNQIQKEKKIEPKPQEGEA